MYFFKTNLQHRIDVGARKEHQWILAAQLESNYKYR